MSKQEYHGTMNGEPAKFVHFPDQQKTDIYWGGIGKPDGVGRNHATVVHAEGTDTRFRAGPDAFHFLRVNGQIIVDHAYEPKVESQRRRMQRSDAGALLAESFRKAWQFNMRNLRGGR